MAGKKTKEKIASEEIENLELNEYPIIVIGASAGGFEVLKDLVSKLPAKFTPPIFIVWHMAPSIYGILPQVLNRYEKMYAAHGYEKEPIKPNRIYVAPPDRHMLIEKGRIRITKGPKENRFRPAVDPLFRSAAYIYGSRVIGVILSGALDDGTSGLWTVKNFGGITIVQDPMEAEVRSMPENALREVEVDYCLPVAQIAERLVELAKPGTFANKKVMANDRKTESEIRIAAEENAFKEDIMKFGELTPFTCPECHGVLTSLRDGKIERYRCHTGHAFSADSLLDSITENVEESLYSAIRGVDESVMLLNHMGDHFAEKNQTKLAALYFKKAKEASDRSALMRQAVISHEQLSQQTMNEELINEEKKNRE